MVRLQIFRMLFVVACAFVFALSAEPAVANDVKEWQGALMDKIRQHQKYPRSAIARKLEGVARVKISIDAKGNITDFEVMKNTGHRILDRQISRLMQRLDPLPVPPDKLIKNGQFTFQLPLVWRLG